MSTYTLTTETYAPTYRYGVAIFGASYSSPNITELDFAISQPAHFVMVENLSDARNLLDEMRANCISPRYRTGNGKWVFDTSGYGEPGDGAYLYRVRRDDPEFSEVIDIDGDRARHAWHWMDTRAPAYVAEFGPRGGRTLTRYE